MGRRNTPKEAELAKERVRARDRLRNKTPARRAHDKKRWTGKRREDSNSRRKKSGAMDRPADKLKVMMHYSKQNLGCAFCGESHIAFLNIHHIFGRKNLSKEANKEGDHLYTYLRTRIDKGLPDSDVLVYCSNCNSGGQTNMEHVRKNSTSKKNIKSRNDKKILESKVFSGFSKKISNSDVPICACCGVNQINFLSLDHIDGRDENDKDTGKTLYGKLLAEYKKTGKWRDGLQVLCFNCNTGKHDKKECPHETDRKNKKSFE